MFGDNTYQEDIKTFKKITSVEAKELTNNENLVVIYIGRSTCPYCRKFAKKLGSLVDQIKTTIYYIDSEDFSDEGIDDFRSEFNVVTVPGFIVKKNNEIEVRCDSSLPEEEILELVK
ncbi:MAG: thioredoxin domain-containing protein [Sarcina sp.]